MSVYEKRVEEHTVVKQLSSPELFYDITKNRTIFLDGKYFYDVSFRTGKILIDYDTPIVSLFDIGITHNVKKVVTTNGKSCDFMKVTYDQNGKLEFVGNHYNLNEWFWAIPKSGKFELSDLNVFCPQLQETAANVLSWSQKLDYRDENVFIVTTIVCSGKKPTQEQNLKLADGPLKTKLQKFLHFMSTNKDAEPEQNSVKGRVRVKVRDRYYDEHSFYVAIKDLEDFLAHWVQLKDKQHVLHITLCSGEITSVDGATQTYNVTHKFDQ